MRGLRRAGLGWVPRLVPRGAEGRRAAGAHARSARSRQRIDWSRTRAYCPSAPGQRALDQPARPRAGGHRRRRAPSTSASVDELRERLLAYRDPRTGEPVVDGGAPARRDLPRTARRRRTRPAGRDGAHRVHGRGPRPARRSCRPGADRRSAPATMRATASSSLHGPDVRAGETLPLGGHRGRRADGAPPPRAAGRRRHGRPGAHRGAAARASRARADRQSRRRPTTLPDERLPATRPTTRSASRTCWRGWATYEGARRRLLPPRRRAGGAARARCRSTHRPYALDAGRSSARYLHRRPQPPAPRAVPAGAGSRRARRRRSSASPSTTAAPATTRGVPRRCASSACARRSSSCRRWSGPPGYVTWPQLREMVAGRHGDRQPLAHASVRARARRGRRCGASSASRSAILEDRLGAAVRSASLPRGWEPPDFERVLRRARLSRLLHQPRRLVVSRRPRAGDAARRGTPRHGGRGVRRHRGRGAPRALWRLQAVDVAKNAAKACLGRGGWQRLRAPLLAWRGR